MIFSKAMLSQLLLWLLLILFFLKKSYILNQFWLASGLTDRGSNTGGDFQDLSSKLRTQVLIHGDGDDDEGG